MRQYPQFDKITDSFFGIAAAKLNAVFFGKRNNFLKRKKCLGVFEFLDSGFWILDSGFKKGHLSFFGKAAALNCFPTCPVTGTPLLLLNIYYMVVVNRISVILLGCI